MTQSDHVGNVDLVADVETTETTVEPVKRSPGRPPKIDPETRAQLEAEKELARAQKKALRDEKLEREAQLKADRKAEREAAREKKQKRDFSIIEDIYLDYLEFCDPDMSAKLGIPLFDDGRRILLIDEATRAPTFCLSDIHRQILEVDEGAISTLLSGYAQSVVEATQDRMLKLSTKESREVRDKLRGRAMFKRTNLIERPPLLVFGYPDSKGYAYNRFLGDLELGSRLVSGALELDIRKMLQEAGQPYNVSDDEQLFNFLDPLRDYFPVIKSMLQRMSNCRAFCQWVGSFFDPSADRKQVVWLSGESNVGKSQWRWIFEHLNCGGHSPVVSFDRTIMDNFVKDSLIGKVVAVYEEADPAFLRDALFKATTGGERQTIRRHSRPSIEAIIATRWLCISNERPEIPDDDSIINRIIDCRMTPFEGKQLSEEEFRNSIKPEVKAFFSFCYAYYQHMGRGKIAADNTHLLASVEDFNGEAHDFFVRHFIADAHSSIPADRVSNLYEVKVNRNMKQFKDWKEYWRKNFNFEAKRPSIGNDRKGPAAYKGFRELSERERRELLAPQVPPPEPENRPHLH